MEDKQLLSDVTIIRPILIVLLVFYHAFAPYSGAWSPLFDYPEIPLYWWLGKGSYAFLLEAFVFVSGYVFGFQVRTKGKSKLEAGTLLRGKFQRLLVPCFFFSLLYIVLLQDITQPVYKTLYGILNGVAHMWFLPMLFWCFIGVLLIEKLQLHYRVVLPLLLILSVLAYIPLPLQLGSSIYYMLFFYLGYVIQMKNISFDRFYLPKYCTFTIISFCLLFSSFTLLKKELMAYDVCVGEAVREPNMR